jgi:hypothetical protein
MNFIEFIGFVVSLFAMFYLFVKQVMDQRRRNANPEAYEEEVEKREELVRKLLQGENVYPTSAHRSISKKNGLLPQRPAIKVPKEAPKKKVVPVKPLPLPSVPKKGKGIDPYALKQVQGPSSIAKALGHLDSKKEIVILSEIYGPPKGFQ